MGLTDIPALQRARYRAKQAAQGKPVDVYTVPKKSSSGSGQDQLHPDPVIPTTPQEIIESNLASSDRGSDVAVAELLHETRTGEPLPKKSSSTVMETTVEDVDDTGIQKVSSDDIRKAAYLNIIQSGRIARNIDPNKTYVLSDGTQVKGSEIRKQLAQNIVSNVGLRNVNKDYIVRDGKFFEDKPESRYLVERGVNRFDDLNSDDKIEYVQRFGRFGDEDKTWGEVKSEEPALYLKATDSGDVDISYDTQRWFDEVKSGSDPLLWKTKMFTLGVQRSFDPDWWTSFFKGEGRQYIADTEYRYMKEYGIGTSDQQVVDFYLGEGLLQSPAYMNVVYPTLIGGGIGAAFRVVGAAGSAAGGGILGKVLTGFSQYAPKVAAVAMTETMVGSLGKSAEMEMQGRIPSGSTVNRALEMGMQTGFAVAGAKTIMDWKPTTGMKVVGDELWMQKHLTTFRGKPILAYGEQWVASRGSGTLAKVIGMAPVDVKAIDFQTPKNIRVQLGKNFQSGLTRSEVSHASSMYDIPWEQTVQLSKYNKNWYYLDTGEGWQPSTGIRSWLSTKVTPKPTVWLRPGKPIVWEPVLDFMAPLETGIPAYIKNPIAKLILKPTKTASKIFTVKDLVKKGVIKLDSKGIETGGMGTGQKTMLIQKTELKTDLKPVLMQDVKSIRHPMYKLGLKTESEKLSIRHPMYNQKTTAALKTEYRSIFHPLYGLKQEQQQGSMFSLNTLSLMKTVQSKDSLSANMLLSLQTPASVQTEGTLLDSLKKSEVSMNSITLSNSYMKGFDSLINMRMTSNERLPVDIIKTMKSKMIDDELIDESNKIKLLKMKQFSLGYREREWKMPRMEDLFNIKELKL